MELTEFDYDLPQELIAQQPLGERDASRMLVLDRVKQSWEDHSFTDLTKYLKAGDVVVTNNTRVIPARLIGRREGSGGRVELFLVSRINEWEWEVLAKPARRLQVGAKVVFHHDLLTATVLEAKLDGRRIVRFEGEQSFDKLLDRVGRTPLPPYIKRDDQTRGDDRERYQTIFAQNRGAIAAPTAGLHFTEQILDSIRQIGVRIVEVTLHVGYGTFEPVKANDLSQHRVASEQFEISQSTADSINDARNAGGRIISVGTTTTRVLESSVDDDGIITPGSGWTDLTILPGHRFRAIDGLLTNFHLPCSSLLVLVSAFAGYQLTMNAYCHAVDVKYRFYSYGDCMLII